MPEGGVIKGMGSDISLKPKGRIEGTEKNASSQESKTSSSAKNQNTSAKALTGVQKGTGPEIKGVRSSAEDSIQHQAKNLNSANNVADAFQKERGQNINEVV